MAQKVIAIMQPTYLPWIGYFDLIDQVDCFVFLDSVQFDRRSWQQRNRIKRSGEAHWLTVPVLSKGRRDQTIDEVAIDSSQNFGRKHLKTIGQYYARAPFFSDYFETFAPLLEAPPTRLADCNIRLIQWLCSQFGITTECLRSSSLEVSGKKTDLLIDICSVLQADGYLSPVGSKVYIEQDNAFPQNDIELTYHSFTHPEYAQLHGAFISHLSALDLLFNEGPASLSIIRSGRR